MLGYLITFLIGVPVVGLILAEDKTTSPYSKVCNFRLITFLAFLALLP